MAIPTTVPKNSPYYYMGNVAPVKSLNVPKVVQPKAASGGGWDADSISKVMGLGAGAPTVGTLGPSSPPPVSAPAVTTTVKPGTPGHWITTDYASMIPGDWEVTDAEARGIKAQGEAEAAFQKALRQAFIDYGGDSSKLGDYAKYIDDPTIQAAQQNKFSTVAQNLAAMTRGLRQQRAQLAARGLTFSGANTEASRRALEAKQLADYTGLRSLLSGADEGTANLATVRATIADKIAEARRSAAARLAAQYPNVWDPGTPDETITTPAPVPVAASTESFDLPTPEPYSPYKYLGSTAPVQKLKVESAAERALRLRSEALNKLYGLG